ncbi:PIN domain nuclease [Vulcanisaeta sp. SCGC AB-777_J10]|jgi:predicted nucleic acid-binding protein|nr:PIN domain nuclease [Vulcanisaeta sp. SCGC AB-777_J10]
MKALKILLDTSFLLPIVGVKVEDDVDDLLKRLWVKFRNREVEIYYTELNLLEISWILSRRAYDPRIVAQGLLSIERNFIKAPMKPSAILKAIELRRQGFNDIIDLMLYVVAHDNNLNFLTIDKRLIKFLKAINEDVSIILSSI